MIYTMTLNPALDYVMHPLTLDMGFTNRASSEELYCGGNGINISTLLKELDVPSIAMGIAGTEVSKEASDIVMLDDSFATIVKAVHWGRGIYENFQRFIQFQLTVNLSSVVVVLDELLERMDVVRAGDTLVLTGSIPNSLPEDIYTQIMGKLAGRGIQFVVDAPGQLLMESLKAHPFLIKPNNHEVGRIYGVSIESPEECMPYAHKLHEEGARNVIISCGGHGSLLLDENGVEHIVPTAKVKLVNATGAGDSMVAGFLAKVTSGEDYETALIFASACGTATAASNGIAKRSKIDRVVTALYKKMGRAMPGTIARDIE